MNNTQPQSGLVRALGPVDATMIVIGSMIGSGIFITSAESARLSGTPGWLLLAWAIAGLLAITGALCCSELATMMPRAGGVYVFFGEAYGPAMGFLYGWTLFLVIQTGTIAAVAIAFAKFLGVFVSAVLPDSYLFTKQPVSLGRRIRDQPFDSAGGSACVDRAPDLDKYARAQARHTRTKCFYVCKDSSAGWCRHYRVVARLECDERSANVRVVGFVGERLESANYAT